MHQAASDFVLRVRLLGALGGVASLLAAVAVRAVHEKRSVPHPGTALLRRSDKPV